MKELNLPRLNTEWLAREAYFFDEIDSTNMYIKNNVQDLTHGAAIVANHQTSGKGRLGRSWMDCGKGVALSFLIRDIRIKDLSCLPLVAGVAVVNALETATGKTGFSLKWSNDVLYGGKKVCGILCESVIMQEKNYAVVGIGVNLTQTAEDFKCLDLLYATSIELATKKKIDTIPFIAQICNSFEPIYADYRENGFSSIIPRYKKDCITLGKEVLIKTKAGERSGIALDVGPDGSLVINSSGKIVHIHAGEASVRGIYGYI